MPFADRINCHDITHHSLTSDAHITQISFQNIIYTVRKNPTDLYSLAMLNIDEI